MADYIHTDRLIVCLIDDAKGREKLWVRVVCYLVWRGIFCTVI